MASFQKTFRKSGSHHAEFHSLQGVDVKIGEKFRPPKKVTLPVGWQQKDPSFALSLTYDFSLERDVIAKAEALRASKQELSEASLAESQVTSSSTETVPNQNSVFSNVGTEILQPVVAPGRGHKKQDSFGGKGKNAFDLADFEGDTSTPFELVELQTINDLDELKNVLQPNAVPAATTENSSSSCDYIAHGLPTGSPGSDISLTASSASLSGNSLIDISSSGNVLQKPSSPIMSRTADTRIPPNANTGGSLLVDVGEMRTSLVSPTTISARNDSVPSSSLSNTKFLPDERPLSRGGLLPPIGQPQGQQPTQITTHTVESRNSYQGGIYSFPKTPPLQGLERTTKQQEIKPDHGHYVTPPSVCSSREPQWNVPKSPDFQTTGGRYPAPLPPIGTSPEERQTNLSADVDGAYRSSLPDPWPVLDESEQAFVRNIASMGFPSPRVSRAVQRLGMKDSELIRSYLDSKHHSTSKAGGHAVVLTSYDVESLRLMNSWRNDWADGGFFRVQNANVLPGLKFFDVFWIEDDLSQEEKKAYKQHGSKIAAKLIRSLQGIQAAKHKCPKCTVMEFLLATQELCEMNYPADTVEVALVYTNTEKAKAVEFLELVKKFKEYGFKENNILDCLQAANNDGDKALEYLMSLPST